MKMTTLVVMTATWNGENTKITTISTITRITTIMTTTTTMKQLQRKSSSTRSIEKARNKNKVEVAIICFE